MIPQAAVEHYDRQAAAAQQAVDAVADLASRVKWRSLVESWSVIADSVFSVVALAQREAAADADTYVDQVLDETGQRAGRAAGGTDAAAFMGVASDGRDLDGLLAQPMWSAIEGSSAGVDERTGLAVLQQQLLRIVITQVQDAGRVASGTAVTARRDIGGYVRMLNPPSCSRCIVLAGRFYRWNAGFLRHPRCDCRHIPSSENVAGDLRTDPAALFKAMTPEQQAATFTAAGAQAVRDGADLAQVVNSRRGMYTASVYGRTVRATREGVTRRGVAGKAPEVDYRRSPRLMPEAIYDQAAGDRDEALRLLRRFRYIT